MSCGVPGQVGSVGPNNVPPGPALLGPADLKVSATLPDDTGEPSNLLP